MQVLKANAHRSSSNARPTFPEWIPTHRQHWSSVFSDRSASEFAIYCWVTSARTKTDLLAEMEITDGFSLISAVPARHAVASGYLAWVGPRRSWISSYFPMRRWPMPEERNSSSRTRSLNDSLTFSSPFTGRPSILSKASKISRNFLVRRVWSLSGGR